jgi:tripartite-type tricarboxylate transporter receptor subunit TctC
MKVSLLVLFAPALALAQPASKPATAAKPGRMVVGYPPGGSSDILGRLVAQKLSENTGQQFIVDNRPGAAGMIGADIVAKSPPDGNTLIVVPATHAVNPSLYAKMPYDNLRDLSHVSLLAESPYMLVVHPSLPVKGARELADLARKSPGQLNYAAASLGGLPHLAGELFNLMNRVKIAAIPYKGGAPATIDLLAGHVPIMFNSMIASIPHVRGNKLRALGVTTLKRASVSPEVPTIAEQGMPGFDVSGWYGVLSAPGLPPEILARLNTEIIRAMRDPVVIKRLAGEGVDVATSTPEEFAARMRSEMERWGKVVRAAGIKAE